MAHETEVVLDESVPLKGISRSIDSLSVPWMHLAQGWSCRSRAHGCRVTKFLHHPCCARTFTSSGGVSWIRPTGGCRAAHAAGRLPGAKALTLRALMACSVQAGVGIRPLSRTAHRNRAGRRRMRPCNSLCLSALRYTPSAAIL